LGPLVLRAWTSTPRFFKLAQKRAISRARCKPPRPAFGFEIKIASRLFINMLAQAQQS
jgi:hypothetical protein